MNQSMADICHFFAQCAKNEGNFLCETWLAPQFIHIERVLELGSTLPRSFHFQVGAQNSSHKDEGALTGEVSPVALAEIGTDFTIIGHSERRSFFQESDNLLREKVIQALNAGLKIIFCIGETLAEREEGRAFEVVKGQLLEGLKLQHKNFFSHLLLAYEPVWAIGTGKTATPDQAQEMHAFIREVMREAFSPEGQKIPILYGGSVKPSNIGELMMMKDINGALVGGASLKAEDYLKICKATSDAAKEAAKLANELV